MDIVEKLLEIKGPEAAFCELTAKHMRCEFEQDLEGTMATICDNPDYSFEPLGWYIRDKAMLRDFYVEALPLLTRFEQTDDVPRFFAGPTGIVMWDRSLLHRSENGLVTRQNLVAIVLRDPATGLIKGEHTFMDEAMAEIFTAHFSPAMQLRVMR